MYRTRAVLPALVLLFGVAAVAFTAPAPPQGPPKMLWEYKITDDSEIMELAPTPKDDATGELVKDLRRLDRFETRKLLAQGMGVLGGQGWELVSVVHIPNAGLSFPNAYHFKRAK